MSEEALNAVDTGATLTVTGEEAQAAMPAEATEATEAPALPEGIESVEDLVARYNEMQSKAAPEEVEAEADEADADTDADTDEDAELTEEQLELLELRAEVTKGKVFEAVGGEEQYNAALSWASETLSDSEAAFYDDIVANGSPDQVKFAAQLLNAAFVLHGNSAEAAPEGRLNVPSGNGPGAKGGFANQSEMMDAMADPRYSYDAAYNAEVTTRLAKSNF